MLSYEALFFDSDTTELVHSLEENRLSNVNDKIHCTFKYHPSNDEIFNNLVGKTFEVYLIGYGNDGNNSGFEILLPPELTKYYINYDEEKPFLLKTPHITTSLADGAKAINTKHLKFNPLKKPIKIIGRFGYWIKEDTKEYESFEPYQKQA